MYISPLSKTSLRNKFFKNKEKEKEKDKDKTPLSKKLYNQKNYIKILPSNKLISRNNDFIKKNTHKVMIRNKSNIEQSIKLISNENSIVKNVEKLMNKTKNLIGYHFDINTQKNNKNQSSLNIYNKSKSEKNNLNLQPNNFINNARKNNIFFKQIFENKTAKDKTEALKNK